jgi:hypothetical protein
MTTTAHPYIRLRQQVRQTGRQFRRNNDNSTSLFHPNGGFICAYDMTGVEDALNDYEKTLPTEFLAVDTAVQMQSQLLIEAAELVESHPEMLVRDFARQVMAYLAIHQNQQIQPHTSFLELVPDIPAEEDILS